MVEKFIKVRVYVGPDSPMMPSTPVSPTAAVVSVLLETQVVDDG